MTINGIVAPAGAALVPVLSAGAGFAVGAAAAVGVAASAAWANARVAGADRQIRSITRVDRLNVGFMCVVPSSFNKPGTERFIRLVFSSRGAKRALGWFPVLSDAELASELGVLS